MKTRLAILFLLLIAATPLRASGPLGIYGIVEKVVFEPNETAAERIQVWGAFAYVEGGIVRANETSQAKRGYLYFSLSEHDDATKQVIRKEWEDLKAVAGTGQAIGFGKYFYIGGFDGLQPDRPRQSNPPHIFRGFPGGNAQADLRVRAESETPANPVTYSTNAGIVKLTDASHAAIIAQLKQALK